MLCRMGIHKTRRARRWTEDVIFIFARCKRCRCEIMVAVVGCE